MNLQRIAPVLILSTLAGMVWLFIHGWLLPGFVLAGALLAAMAYFYGTESPHSPMSKEEELAMWGVKWELDNPAPMVNKTTTAPKHPQAPTARTTQKLN